MAGAKVTITDVSKGITVTTTTNESGNYAQTHLTVGTYKITVEATGFKTSVQENIPISVDANARVDQTLQVGDVTQEVTVSETPPLLKSDRADVSDTLSARGAFSGNALRERPRACAPPSLSSRPSYAATGKGRS